VRRSRRGWPRLTLGSGSDRKSTVCRVLTMAYRTAYNPRPLPVDRSGWDLHLARSTHWLSNLRVVRRLRNMPKKKKASKARWLIENKVQHKPDPLAVLLQRLRKNHAWSEQGMADAIGKSGGRTSQVLVHRISKGSRSVPVNLVSPLASVLGFRSVRSLRAFVELVALSNFLRAFERHERRSHNPSEVAKQANLVLRQRMRTVAQVLVTRKPLTR